MKCICGEEHDPLGPAWVACADGEVDAYIIRKLVVAERRAERAEARLAAVVGLVDSIEDALDGPEHCACQKINDLLTAHGRAAATGDTK